MKRKSVENLLEHINESNIDDSIYFYASLLEQLVELKKELDGDSEPDNDSDDDYVNNSDDDSDNDSDDSDLPKTLNSLFSFFSE